MHRYDAFISKNGKLAVQWDDQTREEAEKQAAEPAPVIERTEVPRRTARDRK